MLTRREFAGIVSCAICGITGLVAAQASAQSAPPAASAGVTRKILSQTDGPAPDGEQERSDRDADGPPVQLEIPATGQRVARE